MPASKPEENAIATGLTVGSILLFAAVFVAGPWAEWTFALLAPLFPVLLVVLATRRRRRSALLRSGIFALGTILVATAVGIRWLEASPNSWWILGVPVSALVGGVGFVLLPLGLVGWLFAATFDDAPASTVRTRRGGAARSRKH